MTKTNPSPISLRIMLSVLRFGRVTPNKATYIPTQKNTTNVSGGKQKKTSKLTSQMGEKSALYEIYV